MGPLESASQMTVMPVEVRLSAPGSPKPPKAGPTLGGVVVVVLSHTYLG